MEKRLWIFIYLIKSITFYHKCIIHTIFLKQINLNSCFFRTPISYLFFMRLSQNTWNNFKYCDIHSLWLNVMHIHIFSYLILFLNFFCCSEPYSRYFFRDEINEKNDFNKIFYIITKNLYICYYILNILLLFIENLIIIRNWIFVKLNWLILFLMNK